ncbi:MAG: undecaprenyl-phosphate galactose phosphotransferase WbaP [Alphaproteobacteria bacterium]|nr:undecaprenyl-phosphate galactose phosphotransferase WbaP [Alphaproteobacteria bacterium]
MTSSFSQPSVVEAYGAGQELAVAQRRLAAIMHEVSSTPVEDFIPQNHPVQKRRDPAAALRWMVATDAIALILGFFVAWVAAAVAHMFLLDRGFFIVDETAQIVSASQYGAISLGVLAWFWLSGHYRRRMPLWLEIQKVTSALFSALILNGFTLFAMKQDFSRLWLLLGWVFGAVCLLLGRALARSFLRRCGAWQVRTLLVGSGPLAEETRATLRTEAGLGYEIIMQVENLPVLLESVDGSWEALCERFSADYVIIALDGMGLAQADVAIADLVRTGTPFSISPPLRHLPVLGMVPQYFFSRDVMLMSPVNFLEQPLPQFLKRSMDVVCSGAALLLLFPLLATICYLVKRDGGPMFFSDIRVGYKGKAFPCLKFRSMVMNGDEVFKAYLAKNPERQKEWDTYHKLRDEDPRITKIGSFLRRWSLDELPQLINVFRGDMSLVGPRPIMFRERNTYSRDFAHYCRVRPGLTGVWQVSGRSDVSFARRVQMDSWYVRNWSLWHDIAILCKTIPAILCKKGAY